MIIKIEEEVWRKVEGIVDVWWRWRLEFVFYMMDNYRGLLSRERKGVFRVIFEGI